MPSFAELLREIGEQRADRAFGDAARARGHHDVLEGSALRFVELAIGVRNQIRALDDRLEQSRRLRVEVLRRIVRGKKSVRGSGFVPDRTVLVRVGVGRRLPEPTCNLVEQALIGERHRGKLP
jgi:hypothetical protein